MKKTQTDLGKDILKLDNVYKVDVITGEADLLVETRLKILMNYKNVT